MCSVARLPCSSLAEQNLNGFVVAVLAPVLAEQKFERVCGSGKYNSLGTLCVALASSPGPPPFYFTCGGPGF